MSTSDSLEYRNKVLGHGLSSKVTADSSCQVLGHLNGEPSVPQDPEDGGRQITLIFRIDQQSRSFILDYLGNAAYICRNHRAAREAGFHQYQPQTLIS